MITLGEQAWCAPEHIGGVPSRRVTYRDILPYHVPEYKDTYPLIEENRLVQLEEEADRIFEVKDTGIIEKLRVFIAMEDVRGDLGDMVMPLHAIKKVYYVNGIVLNYLNDDFFDRIGETQTIRQETMRANKSLPLMYCKRNKGGFMMKTRDPVIHGYGMDGWGVFLEEDNPDSVWYWKDEKADKPNKKRGMSSIAHLLD